MKYYGSCFHSPGQVIAWLGKQSVELRHIHVVGPDDKLPERLRNKPIILFLGKPALSRNKKVVESNAYKNKQAIWLSDPITLMSFKNIQPLDYKIGDDLLEGFVEPKRLSSKAFTYGDTDGQFPERQHGDVTKLLVEKVKERGSILNPLMSLIYTLPNSTHQKPVKVGICHWMFYGGQPDTLDTILDIIHSKARLNPKIRERLTAVLLSDNGDRYRKAFQVVVRKLKKKKEIDYDALAADHSISAYDMRYMRSVVADYSKHGNAEQTIGLEVLQLLKVPKSIQLHRK